MTQRDALRGVMFLWPRVGRFGFIREILGPARLVGVTVLLEF